LPGSIDTKDFKFKSKNGIFPKYLNVFCWLTDLLITTLGQY
jgi:hypothetical protein